MRFDGKNVATTDMNHKYRLSASGFTPCHPMTSAIVVPVVDDGLGNST